MSSKPKIEERNREYRQQHRHPDRQTDPKIQNEINDCSKKGGNAVVNGKNGEQKISRLPFIRIPASWASIQGHKPIGERANLVPGDEQRAIATGWTPPAQRITNHPKEMTDGIVRKIPGPIATDLINLFFFASRAMNTIKKSPPDQVTEYPK
jgi:hypothetical protein